MLLSYLDRAKLWLEPGFDTETIDEVKKMISENTKNLEESFYKNLEFGTGGLRGIMGVGTNRVNKYTVGMATQGFANYLKKSFSGKENLSVAIAFDNRNKSDFFAEITAKVFSANGFRVYIFNELRPTPLLSFTIRHLGCVGGVMITASHNPKEYNGYKVYWDDGAQVTAPHDKNIIAEVNRVDSPSLVKFGENEDNIVYVGEDIDKIYLNSILSLSLSKGVDLNSVPLKIVYTPLHGTGVKLVPEALKMAGFSDVHGVDEQNVTSGDFPTVEYPNPEEPGALKMAIEYAEQIGADLVMATDPDADRVGMAVRDNAGKMVLLNGNQMASLLTFYLLERRNQLGLLKTGGDNGDYMVKTIVTTDLIKSICAGYNVELFNVLTGFKFIAGIVRELEGKRYFIGGGEESYGFNAGEFVRDKDAVIACCLIAECAAWAKSNSMTIYELLIDVYHKFGFYKEHLVSVTKKGLDGIAQINSIMKTLRSSPPESLDGSPVVLIHDYLRSETSDLLSDLKYRIELPKSDVLQFICSDNSVVSVRPSGTEPKIKFYFGVKGILSDKADYKRTEKELNDKIERLVKRFVSL